MFRQLKGKALQACGENLPTGRLPTVPVRTEVEQVIPIIGGTVEQHEARKHPLPCPPCTGYDRDYEDVERVYATDA